MCRSTNVETKREKFLMLNPPIHLLSAYVRFLNTVGEDEVLSAEVDALFAEYEDKVPSFWNTSPFKSLHNPSDRSPIPVIYEDSQPPSDPQFGNVKPLLVTCQVFGIGIDDECGLSEHPIHQEFYGKLLSIVERFKV